MTTPTESTEQTETNSIFDSNEIPTDEQLSKIIDSVNLDNPEIVSTALTTNPPAAQSEIRAKIEKKLETLGYWFIFAIVNPKTIWNIFKFSCQY